MGTTTVWTDEDSPSQIPFYDDFGRTWDEFLASDWAMLQHEGDR